jgi:hypothetical protein
VERGERRRHLRDGRREFHVHEYSAVRFASSRTCTCITEGGKRMAERGEVRKVAALAMVDAKVVEDMLEEWVVKSSIIGRRLMR